MNKNNEGILALLEIPEILNTMSVHGNGFLKIEFTEVLQLHVWHDALPKQTTPTIIHDHIFSFTSDVLAGWLVNTIVKPRWCDGGSYRAAIGGTSIEVSGNHATSELDVVSSFAHGPGSTYKMKAFEFHMAHAVGTTITLMKKDPCSNPNTDSCIVMVHKDVTPDNSFDRRNQIIPTCVLDDVKEILAR